MTRIAITDRADTNPEQARVYDPARADRILEWQ